jgi:cysteinyl-tRNA synthetase
MQGAFRAPVKLIQRMVRMAHPTVTMLKIHNSLTKKKEIFTPIEPGKVRMYVCGMTVYDYCHLGHARVLVVFDMVVRYLRARGLAVTYIRNITDIDDKIIKRANENHESIDALTGRFITAMHEDADRLGVLRPDQEPRATRYMDKIIAMIETLIARGFAYTALNQDVYYRVRSFLHYGELSGKSIDDLQVGARVEEDESKDDPLDFVLWKAAKPDEPYWDSPWGRGRPGWHIECSAMSTCCLGNHFDIHGGGQDLQFPHHENEIAQSEGATGEKFVNLWMHNGFVRVDDEKMSKSLGNFFTIREVLAKYDPEEVRYFILASHYRSPLNHSDEALDNAKAALTRFYIALNGLPAAIAFADSEHEQRFNTAMDDDFNTPVAVAVLFDLVRDINRVRANDPAQAAAFGALLRKLGGILGILQRRAEDYLKGRPHSPGVTAPLTDIEMKAAVGNVTPRATYELSNNEVDKLIEQRINVRKAKNWAESDRIRDELKAHGVILEDGPSGTTWRRG